MKNVEDVNCIAFFPVMSVWIDVMSSIRNEGVGTGAHISTVLG